VRVNGLRGRTAGVLVLAVGLAAAMSLSGTRMAASEGTVLTAMVTDARVPLTDPWSPFWNRVPKVSVPLSAQQITPPMGGHRWTLDARAVQDGKDLYLELEWADPTPNWSVAAPQLFSDAVAVEFPAAAAVTVPALCMGDPNATVNIWQWKAAWQSDVEHGFQGGVKHRYPRADVDWYPFHGNPLFYPGRYVNNPFSVTNRASPVDNLISGGFGTLTADPDTRVQGWGAWRDGRWRVVFARPLSVGDEGNVELGPNDWTDVAFAVWDGSAMERDGMKSVANFVALDVSPRPLSTGAHFPYWPAPFFVFLGLWAAFAWMVVARVPRGREL
jgi:hypothetical protein